MKTIAEVRHENFALIRSSFASATELADVLVIAPSYLSQLTTRDQSGNYRKNFGDKTSRKVEQALGLPNAWLDTPQASYPPNGVSVPLPSPVTSKTLAAAPRTSGIQSALVETAHRLVSAGLLNDMDCLALLQSWQPLIVKLNEKAAIT